jgi:tRNA-modifying protein YgfZ
VSARTGAAVPVESGPDAGAPWHYGDPYAEEAALEEGRAVVDLSHRPVLRVRGADRLTWLHALTTQQLTDLAPHEWTQALVLSPQGHVEHHLTLVDDGEQVLAHVEPGTLDALLDYLRSMVFWSEVEPTDASADLAVVRSAAGDRFVPRADLAAELAAAPALAGLWAAEALRVREGVPRLHLDTDHRTLPAEVGWVGGGTPVHLDKGCYRGQESVAHVHNLGRPPRRLVLLQLDGSTTTLPAHGDPVVDPGDGRAVGFVGTVSRDRELGPVALALVKRNVADGGTLLAGADDGARVSALVETPPAQEAAQQAEPAAAATVQGWRAAARTANRPPAGGAPAAGDGDGAGSA